MANTEEAMRAAMDKLGKRTQHAEEERSYYMQCIQDAKEELAPDTPTHIHITFDFAQQLELPAHTCQAGHINFKSRFNAQLFGICNGAKKIQENYLFNEGGAIEMDGMKAHGPSTVVSMLGDYLPPHARR